jgi:hypothetical protein
MYNIVVYNLDSVWLISRDKKNRDNGDKENKIKTKTEKELYLVVVYKTK